MDLDTLLYICHVFPNYFTARLVLDTFKYLPVFKTVWGTLQGAGWKSREFGLQHTFCKVSLL